MYIETVDRDQLDILGFRRSTRELVYMLAEASAAGDTELEKRCKEAIDCRLSNAAMRLKTYDDLASAGLKRRDFDAPKPFSWLPLGREAEFATAA